MASSDRSAPTLPPAVLQDILENLKAVVFRTDAQGNWTYLNRAWTELTGFDVSESLGQLFLNYVYPEDRERNQRLFAPLIQREKDHCRHEIRYNTKGGGHRWVEVFARLTLDQQGQVVGTTGTLTDITAQRHAQDALEVSNRSLQGERDLFVAGDVVLFKWSVAEGWPVDYVSPNVEALLGYPVEDWLSGAVSYADIIHPGDIERVAREVSDASDSDVRHFTHADYRVRHRDGRGIWLHDHTTISRDGQGEVTHLLGYVLDVTERRLAERAIDAVARVGSSLLRGDDREPPLSKVLAVLGEGLDVSRVYLFANRESEDGELLTSQQIEWVADGVEPQSENPELHDFPYRAGGMGRWVGVLGAGGVISGHVGSLPESERAVLEPQGVRSILACPIVCKDAWWGFIGFDECRVEREWGLSVTDAIQIAASMIGAAIERRSLAEEIERQNLRFAAVLDGLDVVVYASDMETHEILFANRKLRNLFGDVVGQTCWKALHDGQSGPCDFCTNDQLLDENGESTGSVIWEINNPKAGGWWELHDEAIPWEDGRLVRLEVAIPIEERKRGEEAILRASRTEATTTLAGGIAYDFNNLMVAVLSNAELLRRDVRSSDAREMLAEIVLAAGRAGQLSQQLLAFARGGKYTSTALNLNDLIEETLRLQRHSFPPRIRIDHQLSDRLWTVEADTSQLGQVLLNLCINAVEAIEDSGCILITTRNVDVDASLAASHPGLAEGPHVCLSVLDSGRGMDEATRAQIFEPFFSTKGQGRGLGLAAVFGIVDNHGGHISAASASPVGSLLEVFLPASDTPAHELAGQSLGSPTITGETVLVVDDERAVRSAMRRILELGGYRVLIAEDGDVAVKLVRDFEGDIDLVFLDMGMPQMGGAEAFSLLREIRPSLRVVICSGYENDSASRALLAAGARGFLSKPFSMEELTEAARTALEDEGC